MFRFSSGYSSIKLSNLPLDSSISKCFGPVASAVINVPTVFYMFQSTRYEIKSQETTLDSILKIFLTDTTYSTQKLTVVLLVSSLFFAFLVSAVVKLF